MLVPHPDDTYRVLESSWEYLEDELPHYLVSAAVSAASGNPLVGAYLHLYYHYPHITNPTKIASDVVRNIRDSRGGGGPSALTQSPPSSSKGSRQARASAQGGKSGAPARASTQGSRPRRESCPKGHYWSFKHGKCMKSKYR